MSGLHDLQTAFQNRLLSGDADILVHLGDGGPFMKVYDNAYTARLLEVLGEDFPALHTLLGDADMAKAMRAYLNENPSDRPSIRWVGRNVPAWLAQTQPWSEHSVLTDMAAFEWAFGLTYDAPDAPHMTVNALADIAPETWPNLTFVFHPAFHAVRLDWDVVPFHQAVTDKRDPDAAPEHLETPVTWALWRHPELLTTHYRPLGADEADAIAHAQQDASFAELCEVVAAHGAPEQAAARMAGLLRNWVENGWITAVDIIGGSLATR